MKKILSDLVFPIAIGLVVFVNLVSINQRLSSLNHNVEQLASIAHTLSEIAESTTATDTALLDSVQTLQRRAIESDSAPHAGPDNFIRLPFAEPYHDIDPGIVMWSAPTPIWHTNWNNSDIITWGTNTADGRVSTDAFDFDYTNTRHRSL